MQNNTRRHMHKASAEINEIRVPRWRGFTHRTQTHRDRLTCAYASTRSRKCVAETKDGARAEVPRDGSNINRDQTCLFWLFFLYFFSIAPWSAVSFVTQLLRIIAVGMGPNAARNVSSSIFDCFLNISCDFWWFFIYFKFLPIFSFSTTRPFGE